MFLDYQKKCKKYVYITGVLTFNEVGAFIVEQMTGEKSLREIEQTVKETFPTIDNSESEVVGIVKQLQEAGFF